MAEALHPPRAVARQRAELARMSQGREDRRVAQGKLDDGDSSLRNGHGLGPSTARSSPVEAEGPLFQLNDGEAAIVEMSSGYHVIRVVKREHAGVLDFRQKRRN